MSSQELFNIPEAIISMVPQWYTSTVGRNKGTILWDGAEYPYYTLQVNTPRTRTLLSKIQKALNKSKSSPLLRSPSFIRTMQEFIAIEWLKSFDPNIDWTKLVSYLTFVAERTYENKQVNVNIIVSEGAGKRYIDYPARQKVFDELATSPFTFFRIDRSCKIISYSEVAWNDVTDTEEPPHYPSFLHPIHCTLGDLELSAHVTSSGDIVIMNKEGIIASKRKGYWKVYDVKLLEGSIVKCLNDYPTAANLFQVIFDLSFRRHGALLIYDPKAVTLDHIANPESILGSGGKTAHAAIAPALEDIAIGNITDPLRKRRLLTEIASIDGAVIFDSEKVLAIGAIIRSSDDVGGQAGARSTAALSAFKYGAHPIKISSDGEITLYFYSRERGQKAEARMEFL